MVSSVDVCHSSQATLRPVNISDSWRNFSTSDERSCNRSRDQRDPQLALPFLIGGELRVSLGAKNGSNYPFESVFRNSFSTQALNSKVGRILFLTGKALADMVFMVTSIMKK